jgi:hypothetical protein
MVLGACRCLRIGRSLANAIRRKGVSALWMFLAMIVAVRQALDDTSTGRAVR